MGLGLYNDKIEIYVIITNKNKLFIEFQEGCF